MPLIGSIEAYIPGSTSFSQYVEQIEWIFIINKIPDDEKLAYFLGLCGRETYSELKLLHPGVDLATKTYESIIDSLKRRFDKVDTDMFQRYKFYNMVQGESEAAEDFILKVKLQAESCEFGAFKETAIRDRLVMGVLDKQVQQRLLEEEDLTLAKVEKIIVNRECAGVRTRMMNSNNFTVVAKVGDSRREVYRSRRSRSKERWNKPYKSRSRSRSHSRSSSRSSPTPRKSYFCSFCSKKGHTKKYCFELKKKKKLRVKFVDTPQTTPGSSSDYFKRFKRELKDNESDSEENCMKISSVKWMNEPCFLEPTVDHTKLRMEVDCGSAVSVIDEQDFRTNFSHLRLEPYNNKLIVVDGANLEVLGCISVSVFVNGISEHNLELVILKNSKNRRRIIPLFGRKWLDVFFPAWRRTFSSGMVNMVSGSAIENTVEEVKCKFGHIFNKTFLDPIVGFEGDLMLKEDRPVFRKAYEVPLGLRDKVIDHLDTLERDGVITPLEASEWASPVVVVVKKNQDIRLVIDCKVSINKLIIPSTYPLPNAQDLFASLAGAKIFCSLDLAGAYTQLKLSKRSQKFMVINTLKGLYTYNRLPQGASSSASIFQKVMDQVLKGLPFVICYLDDVLIAGVDFEDCKKNLFIVLDRLSKANIKVNLNKCNFFVDSLPYLGHIISDKGLMPCPDKVETIRAAKPPQNVSELKAFLGLLNFYGKFIPHLSSRLSCLYRLLKKDVRFIWSKECQRTFEECKAYLLNGNLLEFYDPKKPLVVISDASSYGIGGVIAHEIGGVEKPISFTSFSLNSAQQKYPILHLEALAVVSTVKKFHKFLYGHKFTIYTDHKPLIGIFGKEGRNSMYVTRLQRYVMELSIYDFDIVYRPSSRLGNADFCSRFPLPNEVPNSLQREYIKSLSFSSDFPLDYNHIARETEKDSFLQQIKKYIEHGWPDKPKPEFKDVHTHYQDLEIVDGCILFQDRVIIPLTLQQQVLKMLHKNHTGITKVKQLARRTVYWFGLNRDIEKFVKSCRICNEMYIAQKPKTTNSWIPTTRPFSRLHADFFYFQQKVFLIIVDSKTKWLEIEYMPNGTDSCKVIKKFIAMFARVGLPDVVVTDGGPPFNSLAFIRFLENQGIKVMKSPPYNPQSNGQAERMVRLIKEVFKKFLLDPEMQPLDIEEKVCNFLFNYRNICLEDGHFPSERVFTFKPKTNMDLINPKSSYKRQLTTYQHDKTESNYQRSRDILKYDPLANLTAGEPVYYKNHNPTDIRRWLEAKFIKRLSMNVFQISLGGRIFSAHRQQLRLTERTPDRRATKLWFDRDPKRDQNQEPAYPASQQNFQTVDTDEEDFYGFASESQIFDAPVQSPSSSNLVSSTTAASSSKTSSSETVQGKDSKSRVKLGKRKNLSTPNVRRSKRAKIVNKNEDFIYF